MKRTVILDKTELPGNWWQCSCGNYAEMKAICEATYDSREEYAEEPPYWYTELYKVLKCPACKKVTILKYHYTGVDEYMFYTAQTTPDTTITWICSPLVQPPRIWHSAVPGAISDVLTQAEQVIQASPRAALILCRVALEELCDVHNIPRKGNLKQRLKELVTLRHLPDRLTEILTGIRILGNEGAHGTQAVFEKEVTSNEAHILIDLSQFVLDRIYVDKARDEEAQDQMDRLLRSVTQVPKKGNSK